MKQRIGFFGTRGVVTSAASLPNVKLMSEIGQNSGNLLFQYAVFNLIDDQKVIVGKDISWDVNEVRANCDLLVVPSANFLRENFDFTEMVGYLEKTKLPVLFVGLGAQADSFDKSDFSFHPSILDLIALIKDQSIGVSVRGKYTERILRDAGVEKVVVTGCPSNFINRHERMQQVLEEKWGFKEFDLAVNADEPWPKSPSKQEAEQRLYKYCSDAEAIYVQQSVEPFVRMVRAKNGFSGGVASNELFTSLRNAIAPTEAIDSFKRFFQRSVRFYISVDQWLEDLSRYSLSIGLRLHGNMAAMQAGCPAIWVVHDARTQELVDTMGLPNLSVDQFLACKDIDECKARTEFDLANYFERRSRLKGALESLFLQNGVGVL